MRMRSSSCPHIDFLGGLNKQLATPTEPSPARLQELNDILLTLHKMLPQSCGDEDDDGAKADSVGDDDDDNDDDDGADGEQVGERESNGVTQYSSVPGLIPAANNQHVHLLDHQLLSIGYTLLAVKIELKSLSAHLPDQTKFISKLEVQIEELECERIRKLQVLGAAHDGIGKIQLHTPLDAQHMSPLKSSRGQMMGSVEVIDEIPDDDEAATFRTAAPFTTTTTAATPAHQYTNGHHAAANTPEHGSRRGLATTTAGSLLLPGSRSIDGSSTGNSSIWHVTPDHQAAGAGALGPGVPGLAYPSSYTGSGMRARSDDYLTDSDASEFPSGRQSLQRAAYPPATTQQQQRHPQHYASMGSLGGGGGMASHSASHWSLKSSSQLGTSPYPPTTSSLMSSHGSGGISSSLLHMSMESLPASPKVANGAFEQPPSRRMSIVGRRSVTKFSVIRGSVSSSATATTPGSTADDDDDDEAGRFPSPSTPSRRTSGSDSVWAMASAVAAASVAAGNVDTIDRSAWHPSDGDADADAADALRHRQQAISHEERVNHINSKLKEKFGDGVQLLSANGGPSHSPSPVPTREVRSRSRSGRRHSGGRAARRSSSPTTVVVHNDGTVRMGVQRRSSSRRRSRVVSATSFTSAKIDQRLATLQELVRIEQEYIQSLRTVQSVYATPMSSLRILSSHEKVVIFPRELLAILRRHEKFLQSLEACLSSWSPSSMLGGSFNILSSQEKQNHSLLSCYRKYLDNFPDAMQLLSQKMRVSECVRSFVQEASAGSDSSQQTPDLSTLLVQPIKRLPQYISHIKALLKSTPEGHPDKKPLLQAVQVLNNALPAMQESVQASTQLLDLLAPEQRNALHQARDSIRQSLRYTSHTKAKAEQRSRKRASFRNRYSERPIDVDGLDNLEPGHNSLAARRLLDTDGDTRPVSTRRKPSRKLSLKYVVNAWQQRNHAGGGSGGGGAGMGDTSSASSSSAAASGGNNDASSSSSSSSAHGHHHHNHHNHHNVRVKRQRHKAGGSGHGGGAKGVGRSKTFSAGDGKDSPELRMSKSRSVEHLPAADAADGGLTHNAKDAFKARSCLTMPGRYEKHVQQCDSSASSRKDQRSGSNSPQVKVKRRNSSKTSKTDHFSQARAQSAKIAAERLKLASSQAQYVPDDVKLLPDTIASATRGDDVAGDVKNNATATGSGHGDVVAGHGDVIPAGDDVGKHARADRDHSGGGGAVLETRTDGTPDPRHRTGSSASASSAAGDGRRVKRLKSTTTAEIADNCKMLTNAIITEFGKENHSQQQQQNKQQQQQNKQEQQHTTTPSPNHFQSPHRTRQCAIRGPHSKNASPAGSPHRLACSPHRAALAHRKLPTMKAPGAATAQEHAAIRDHGDSHSAGSHSPVAVAKSYKMAAVNLPQSPLSKKNSVASFGDVAVVPGNQNGGGALPAPISLPSPPAANTSDLALSDSVFTPSPTTGHDSSMLSPGHRLHTNNNNNNNNNSSNNRAPGSAHTLPVRLSSGCRPVADGKEEELSLFSMPAHPTLPRLALTNGLAKKLAQPGFSYAPSASGRNIVIVKGPKKSKHTVLLKLKFWKNRGSDRSGGKAGELIA